MHKKLFLTLTIMAISCAALHADDLYRLSWKGTQYSNDDSGRVVARRFTEKDIVQQVAEHNGLDARDLVLVYRANKRDIAVVQAATGEFVGDAIQMEYSFTDVTNEDQSITARQAFLFDESHDQAIGSAFGTERQRRNADGELMSYSFKGNFNYAHPDEGTVYSGTFSTGKRVQETAVQ
jgi:hypothetical protein